MSTQMSRAERNRAIAIVYPHLLADSIRRRASSSSSSNMGNRPQREMGGISSNEEFIPIEYINSDLNVEPEESTHGLPTRESNPMSNESQPTTKTTQKKSPKGKVGKVNKKKKSKNNKSKGKKKVRNTKKKRKSKRNKN